MRRSLDSASRRAARRGFTLLEIVIVIAIIAIIGAMAVPMTNQLRQREALRGASRMLVMNLRAARTSAASGQTVGVDADGRAVRARFGGLAVLSATQYVVFVDADGAPGSGDEQTLRTVDFLAEDPQSRVRIAAPSAGQEVRFTANGTLAAGSQTGLRLIDEDTNQGQDVAVSLTGHAQLR